MFLLDPYDDNVPNVFIAQEKKISRSYSLPKDRAWRAMRYSDEGPCQDTTERNSQKCTLVAGSRFVFPCPHRILCDTTISQVAAGDRNRGRE
jgi:hypothetical protein